MYKLGFYSELASGVGLQKRAYAIKSCRSSRLYHTHYIQDASTILFRVLPSCIVSTMCWVVYGVLNISLSGLYILQSVCISPLPHCTL